MTSLARMATAELRDVIRKNPARRAAAWDEVKFRNQARQAFERETGQLPRWNPPDLTPPAPLPKD